MTLGFKTHFPDGTPTHFEQKILLPYILPAIREKYADMLPKIHTFRLGTRWRAGMTMHMVTGNRTSNRYQFNKDIPELEHCISVQPCIIRTVNIAKQGISVEVEGREIDPLLFAVNDGFNSPDRFFEYFAHPFKPTEHVGQIVHFSNFRY